MSQQAQVTRWQFQSDFTGLIVYHESHKIARFAGGEFETSDRAVAEALRGFDTYCHEIVPPPIPMVIHNAEAPAPAPAAPRPAKSTKAHE